MWHLRLLILLSILTFTENNWVYICVYSTSMCNLALLDRDLDWWLQWTIKPKKTHNITIKIVRLNTFLCLFKFTKYILAWRMVRGHSNITWSVLDPPWTVSPPPLWSKMIFWWHPCPPNTIAQFFMNLPIISY